MTTNKILGLNVKFISPDSVHKFIPNNQYYLIFTGYHENNIIINKIQLKNINNITDTIITYIVNKHITLPKINSLYSIKLFSYNKQELELLFTTKIDLNNNIPEAIIMYKPTLVNGKNRHTVYVDETSFFDEVFYNYETHNVNEKCVLFMSQDSDVISDNKHILIDINKLNYTLIDINKLNYTLIDINKLNYTFVYDKYNQSMIKETMPNNFNSMKYTLFDKLMLHNNYFSNNFCSNSITNDYKSYIDYYQIDTNIFNPDKTINLKYRPIFQTNYMNNIMIAPMDGRYYKTVISKFKELFNLPIYNDYGINQIVCRNSPQDHGSIFIPYPGYLKEINTINNMYVLKFVNDYYIPPNTNERAYMSVLNGNHIYSELGGAIAIGGLGVGVGAGSRGCPETLNVQPDYKLIYYLIIPTNVKLLTSELKWYDIGIKLGYFECDKGFIGISSNRLLNFEQNINVDIKLKARDILAYIK
jgi:hypothetical protein